MSEHPDDALPEWTEDELALLRSADRDQPPSRSLPATLAAVGVGSAILSSAAGAHGAALSGAAGAAAASAKWGGIAAVSKWVAVAALGGAVIAGGVVLSKRSDAVSRPSAQAPRRRATSPKLAATPPVAAPADEVSPETVPVTAPAASRSPAAKRAPSPSQPDIRVEIAAIDAAMKAFRSGDAGAALAALDRYDAQYGRHGALRVEATALRIEALMRAGQRAKASALAAAFLASHPRSPYAARIRALADSAPSTPPAPE
jgi:hypothetical protein